MGVSVLTIHTFQLEVTLVHFVKIWYGRLRWKMSLGFNLRSLSLN